MSKAQKPWQKSTLSIIGLISLIATLWAKPACNTVYRIEGVEADLKKQIESALIAWQNENGHTCPNDATLGSIVQASSKPFGYFSATITIGSDQEDKVLHIQPGKVIRYRTCHLQIEGEGEKNQALQKLVKQSLLTPGQAFSSQSYQEALHTISQAAQDQGYLHASTAQSHLVIDPKTLLADTTIVLTTGKRYWIGAIDHKIEHLKKGLVDRLLQIKPGTPYAHKAIASAQDRLMQSGYFQNARITPIFKDNTIPLRIEATPAKRFHEAVGGGYDTDLGWQLKGAFRIKPLNAWGHALNVQLNYASRESIATIRYIWPGRFPPSNYHQLTSQFQHSKSLDAGSSDLTKLSYQSILKRWGATWEAGLFLHQELTSLNYNDSRFKTELVYPQLDVSGKWRHQDIWMHHPFTLSWHAMVLGAKSWPEQNTLIKLSEDAQFKWFISEDYRLVARERYAWIQTRDLSQAPLSMQLALGGSTDLRGYAYQSIPGNESPGRSLKFFSIEGQKQLSDPWFAVAFFDTGNVSRSLSDEWKRSIGVGVMWSSALGDLTLSIAHPLDDPDTHWRLHLNLNT